MTRQHVAGRRRPDAARFTEQELRADLMLHIANSLACRSRSEMCVAGALRDARGFHYAQEQTQIRQIKAHGSETRDANRVSRKADVSRKTDVGRLHFARLRRDRF